MLNEGFVSGNVMNKTGNPIMTPVRPETLGRIIIVVKNPIDERGPASTVKRQAVHMMSVEQEILHQPYHGT